MFDYGPCVNELKITYYSLTKSNKMAMSLVSGEINTKMYLS